MKTLPTAVGALLDAYGALFLAPRRRIGALVLAATLCDPATGLAGLVAGLAALASRALLRLPAQAGEADLLNAIYAGLALGAFYGVMPQNLAVNGALFVYILAAFGGALVIPVGAALRPMLAGPLNARGLPLLGAPFLCTAWVLLASAKGLALPLRTSWPLWPLSPEWLTGSAGTALAHVGALFYVAHPLAGLLVLTALLQASPILALLALGGGLLAQGLVLAAGVPATSSLVLLAAFNGALVAIFIGAVLSAPTFRSLLLAAAGVVLASALSAGFLALATPFGLPPLSAPFLLTTWLARAALRPESSAWWARFWLATPTLPEHSRVAGRLATARGLAAGSVSLLPPFKGHMDVAQSIDGALTHDGPWRYALDFVSTENGYSYRNDAGHLNDFYAYNQPVLSPVWGRVAACRDDIADNAPGLMNLIDNWGNHVLIDIGGGLFVLLAHLRQGSISELGVIAGEAVAPGTLLGCCGNSGRSAQPHLHLHVQRGAWLGAPTVPFHLSHCLLDGERYVLDATPAQGQNVAAAHAESTLAIACAPLHGRVWQFDSQHGKGADWQLAASTDLLGNTALHSDKGARIEAVAGPGLLALHRRSGKADTMLDAFALAFGLTPYVVAAAQWHDAPDAALLPLRFWQGLGVLLCHPFGANLDSRYQRHWDAGRELWCQSAKYRISGLFGNVEAESIGWLSESLGPVAFSLSLDGQRVVEAALAGYGNRGDHGVPAWSLTTAPKLPLLTIPTS